MSDIIRERDLLAQGLNFIKADQVHVSDYVQLSGEVSDFIDFCRSQKVPAIVYKYFFYDKEKYTVTEDILSMNTENNAEREFCSTWVEEYNRAVDHLDFENPYALSLCALTGAVSVVYRIENQWMTIDQAESALLSFLEEHEDELFDCYEYKEGSSLMDELASTLLSDKEFRFCTNKGLRSAYMERFMSKKVNKRYWGLVKGERDEWRRRFRINDIVNQIYNEYRNRCYNCKIQVGEELPPEE